MIKYDKIFIIPLALLTQFIIVCINILSTDAFFWDIKCFKSLGFKKKFKVIRFSLSFPYTYTYKEYVIDLYYIIV